MIDTLMDAYVDWREECIGVRQAYEHWSSVGLNDQALACAAYGAALDREETAARVYSGRLSRIEPIICQDQEADRRHERSTFG